MDLESIFHHYGGPVKLVQASLWVRNNIESRFHRCRGLVKVVHARFSVGQVQWKP